LIQINQELTITDNELRFAFSRSGGPGGQNVNKVSSRVTLLFDVTSSPALSDDQRQRIMNKLQTRINREGVLRVVCQKYRNQSANREEAINRFVDLLRQALKKKTPRKKSRVSQTAIEKRMAEKKLRGQLKQKRSENIAWEE